MTTILPDSTDSEARYWAIAKERRRLMQRLEELDAELALLNAAEEYVTTPDLPALLPPEALLPRMSIKVDGEWEIFHRIDDKGDLVLTRDGSACPWTYTPTDGETFAFCELF